ncbi:MAG: extracellular solute-binding protein [Peptococcales bacterium]|jgi:putative aldouronate transport system substrate-binding protein
MKKLLVVLLVLVMAMTLFAQASKEKPTTPVTDEDPFKDYVELIMYSSGSSGQDKNLVMEKFNALLKEKCNTTINVTCLGWDNYRNQYQLILTTGEPADLMYVNPSLYGQYAPTGAFTDVTELFPKFMPTVYSYFSEGQIAQAKVNGSLYEIPSHESNFGQNGIFYRQDLGEKYGVSTIDSIESFEAYADAIVANEPAVRVIDGNPEQALFQFFKAYYGFEAIAGSTSSIIMVKSMDDIHNIIAYPFTDEYVEWAKRMNTWAKKGYWSSNALSSTMDPWSSIQVGTSAITQANADGAKSMMKNMATKVPQAKCAYWSFADLTGYSFVNPITENGYAIPTSSPNAERALRVLEIIKTDQQLFDFWMYGIEGRHFSLTPEGNLIRPAVGVDPATISTHSMSGAQYAMRVSNLMRNDADVWEGYPALMDYLKSIAVLNKFGSVSLDYTAVQPELAAVNQVVQQYGLPINIGIVEDVDTAIAEYRKQLKAAGVERLLKEVSRQMEDYYKRNNIN